MLKNLTKQYNVIHIAGREYRVRYSLNALLCLEMTFKPLDDILAVDFKNWDMDTVSHLAHAAMCSLRKNRKAVIRRDFEHVYPDLHDLGEMIRAKDLSLLKLEIVNAVLASLPAPDSNAEKSDKATNEGHLRAMYVDIIGRSEGEFWDGTYKEISYRIDCYLETKGLKDTPTRVQMFDD